MDFVPERIGESKRYRIFNTFVDALSFEETIGELERVVQSGVPSQHVVLNASKINMMQKDEKLTEIVNSCALINADGMSVVWAAKRLGIPVPERVAGIDVFQRLLAVAAEKGYGVYLFGAREEVLGKLLEVLKERHPALRVAGSRNGYFSAGEEDGIVADIAASKADMLFVAFSSPRKEYWVHKHLRRMGVPLVMGVGGSFDVLAGKTTRAPLWMQKMGLEWFHRFIQEPARLFERYMVGNAKFVRLTLREKRKLKRARSE